MVAPCHTAGRTGLSDAAKSGPTPASSSSGSWLLGAVMGDNPSNVSISDRSAPPGPIGANFVSIGDAASGSRSGYPTFWVALAPIPLRTMMPYRFLCGDLLRHMEFRVPGFCSGVWTSSSLLAHMVAPFRGPVCAGSVKQLEYRWGHGAGMPVWRY